MAGLLHPRVRPRAALLDDGRVLVAGGERWDGRKHALLPVLEDEVIDPRTLTSTRAQGDERAHLLGLDPDTKRFVALDALPREASAGEARGLATIAGGKVLAAGGERTVNLGKFGLRPEALATVSIGRGAFCKLAHPRSRPAVCVLLDGSVLVSGGYEIGMDYSWEDTQDAVAACERVSLSTKRASEAGALRVPRWSHAAVLLPDGTVLVLGGARANDHGIADVERLTP